MRNRGRIAPIFIAFALALTLLTTGCTTAARLARPLRQAGSALFTAATDHSTVLLPDRLTWTAQ